MLWIHKISNSFFCLWWINIHIKGVFSVCSHIKQFPIFLNFEGLLINVFILEDKFKSFVSCCENYLFLLLPSKRDTLIKDSLNFFFEIFYPPTINLMKIVICKSLILLPQIGHRTMIFKGISSVGGNLTISLLLYEWWRVGL